MDSRPCSHSGCQSHITHPCEKCGRIGGCQVYEGYVVIETDTTLRRLQKVDGTDEAVVKVIDAIYEINYLCMTCDSIRCRHSDAVSLYELYKE